MKGLLPVPYPACPSLCSHRDLVSVATANPTGLLSVYIQKYRGLKEEEGVSQ